VKIISGFSQPSQTIFCSLHLFNCQEPVSAHWESINIFNSTQIYACMSLGSLSACSALSGRAVSPLAQVRSVSRCFDPVNVPKGPASTSIGLCSFLSPLFVQNQWGQGNASTGKMVLYCQICSFAGYSSHLETLTGRWNGWVRLTVFIQLIIQTWEPPFL
jgi:hypothetical protein